MQPFRRISTEVRRFRAQLKRSPWLRVLEWILYIVTMTEPDPPTGSVQPWRELRERKLRPIFPIRQVNALGIRYRMSHLRKRREFIFVAARGSDVNRRHLYRSERISRTVYRNDGVADIDVRKESNWMYSKSGSYGCGQLCTYTITR